ncbi:MAG: DUF3343 domain-containing protein [Hyphomicrobiales bacterium]
MFENIRQVIKTEKYARTEQLYHKVMPVPRDISSECGMCLLVDAEALDSIQVFLQLNKISYRVEERNYEG